MVTRLAVIFLVLLLSCDAAEKYLRAGASGTGSGNDYMNAYTTLAALESGMARGDTGYIAGGAYAGTAFNTAATGTTLITIKRATVADHGSASDWSNAYDAQVTIDTSTTKIEFLTSYWVFTGVTGAGVGSVTPYGIKVTSGEGHDCINITGANGASPVLNVVVSYIEMQGVATLGDYNYTAGTKPLYFGFSQDCTADHVYIHGGETLITTETGTMATNSLRVSVTNSVMQASRSTNGGFHSNVFYVTGSDDGIFANNYCFNYNDEGFFLSGFLAVPNGWHIYNNQFWSGGGPLPTVNNPRGVEFLPYNFTGTLIYGNTFVDMIGLNNTATSNVGCEFTNNLIFGGTNTLGTIPNTTNTTAGSSTIFQNYATGDFHLTSDTAAWTALGAPYNVDAAGVTRTSTRGAYQYVSAAVPAVPTNYRRSRTLVGGF